MAKRSPNPGKNGEASLNDILPGILSKLGIGRQRKDDDFAACWKEMAADLAAQTRFNGIRRGVVEILAQNSLIIQELSYRKDAFLETMRQRYPDASIKDLRFRIGLLEEE